MLRLSSLELRTLVLMFVTACFFRLARSDLRPGEVREEVNRARRHLLQEEEEWPGHPPEDTRSLIKLFYRMSKRLLRQWLREEHEKLDKKTRLMSKEFFRWAKERNITYKGDPESFTEEKLEKIVDDPKMLSKRFFSIILPMLRASFKETAYEMKEKSFSFVKNFLNWVKKHYANLKEHFRKMRNRFKTEYKKRLQKNQGLDTDTSPTETTSTEPANQTGNHTD